MKPKLGIDLDDVLADTWNSVLPFLNNKFRKDFRIEDIISYKLSDVFCVSAQEIFSAYEEMYQQRVFLDPPLIPGAVEAISRLVEYFDPIVLTSRPLYMKDQTLAFVENRFPSVKKIHLTHHPGNLYHAELTERKVDVCLRDGIGVIIDDCAEHIIDCTQSGVRGLLFDLEGRYAWNKGCNAEGIERVTSWKEAVDKLTNGLA